MSKKFIVALVFAFVTNTVISQAVKAMTYNIKYDNTRDTINNWNYRKDKMVDLIQHYNPSFLGIQEGLHNQVNYLNINLPKYNYIGVGRDDGKEKGEYSAIYYNNDFKLITSNTFWLSTTPNKISVGWDAAMERICTYGLFQHKKTKQYFWVFNAHFDHIGVEARKNSAKLIVEKIKTLNTKNYPVIIMGDFNVTPTTEAITTITNYIPDSYSISKTAPYGPKGTFNGFTDHILTKRIDYIFAKHLNVLSVTIIDDRLDNNKHISDHLPVLATVIKE
ncbi:MULTISPECIES: endonuclease/exonuclease/phosphatase family protein [unclassified Cellulophaga]|uniref:endonuclease/exonuclease/phosphatase family protein n=1 Tax=unclassified Cellulophaga TaxID=2634405 RepID=UPI0026E32048|nr:MULTISPECIES: endonuclease/exonuclease/phosphatase family protein [unclassified Cellulophaga]MDO6492292.1 endonuclease/exonuclease/phosphatase family protein [Cellulophaga sp. 2_MG-2023]MDO6493242.1 endonuclease/exonuclease/phosphatase family protein [Cellulophaga sp. 3_MG-2023]